MSNAQNHINFDGDPVQLVEDAYSQAHEYQYAINEQCKSDYLMYRAFVDMSYRDNSMPQIALPKLFSVIEHKTSQELKALFGTRPYIPLESKRKEFQPIVETIETALDEYLERANFFNECSLGVKIKTMSGASFMEFVPDMEPIDKIVPMTNTLGLPDITSIQTQRFRLRCRVYAPWEVYIDPFATNLESIDGCRYVVKFIMTSKRVIQQMQDNGSYLDLDIDKLNTGNGQAAKKQDHYGAQILSEFGLDLPVGDDDIGILLRYESPDRYIDVWNGTVVLRDIDNPYKGQGMHRGHGGINLCRMIHMQDAHTQNRIWGIGEVKPNEVQAMMLDDLWNAVFRREQFAAEPLIFFRSKAVDVNDLYWEMSNRIPIKEDFGRPISDSVIIHSGQELPKDQFNLLSMVERNIDMTSSEYAPLRGEGGKVGTATEIMEIRETGSERQEQIIKNGEQVFLKSVADKCLGHMNQFGTIADFEEIVGMEKAMQLAIFSNPRLLPGGYDFRFKGSARIVNLQIKQRNLKELAPVLVNLFNNAQFELARTILEAHEIPSNEIESIMNENIMKFQMMMGMAAQQNQVEGGQPGNKYKENNQQQISQDNAKTLRGE